MRLGWALVSLAPLVWSGLGMALARAAEPVKPFRLGIVGLDTSHAPALARHFNVAEPKGEFVGIRVVAAFPGGSPDLPISRDRVAGFTADVRAVGVEIVDSIPALLERVDGVLLESVDGRPHLEQVRPIIAAGKPVFIDKPVAASLRDAVEIFRLASEAGVPCFSSSALRFSPGFAPWRNDPKLGSVLGCETYGPCEYQQHQPDLFWYGIHGIEALYTIMGPGCATVSRVKTNDTDLVTGVWSNGRVGVYRGLRAGKKDFGGLVFAENGIQPAGPYGGYDELALALARFFRSGTPPVSAEETLEIVAFMEAADESLRREGRAVPLAEMLERAGWRKR